MMLSWIKPVADFVFGYDYFISYSHRDGKHYPARLAEQLQEAGFNVFLDAQVYVPGIDLKAATKRRVRMSKYLVVVLRKAALESAWVPKEVEHCLANKGPVIAVDINDTFKTAPASNTLKQLIEDHLRVSERIEDPDGDPTRTVVDELIRSFKSTRQETLRLRVVTAAALVLLLSLVLALWMYQRSETARAQAVAQRDRALRTQSLFLADLSEQATVSGDTTTGVLLALEGLPGAGVNPDRPYQKGDVRAERA